MTETITVNAVDRSGVIRRETVEWAENAYLGEVGEGHFTIDDAAGTIAVPGHKAFSVVQSSSSPTNIARGYTGRKAIARGSYSTGAAREINVTTQDLNVLLGRIAISGTDGKRPAETVSARVTWLLASDYLSTLVFDDGAVAASTITMDANDYRGQYPGDVLAACAKACKFNYYVRWNVAGAEPELVFRDDDVSTDDTSTVSISNAGDADGTSIFAPQQEAELTQDPEHVYSEAYYTWSKGADIVTRTATATAFAQRTGITEDTGTKTSTVALRDAEAFLDESDDEEQLLPVTLRMRATYVGLVQAGQRISTRMTHMAPEGWDPAQYARILRKRVTQPLNTDNDYDVYLELAPQEAPPAAEVCDDLYPPTPSDTYYALGGVNGSGSHPNASDGVVHYWRGGYVIPSKPGMTEVGSWHFGVWGAGGNNTTDWAGDCSGNALILITSGNGTWTITTEVWAGSTRPLQVRVGPTYESAEIVDTGVSGDTFVIEISDATDGDCVRSTRVYDFPCVGGGKWGFSGAAWVAA